MNNFPQMFLINMQTIITGGDIMPDIFNLNQDMQQYLATLPVDVQEAITSSNVKISSTDDLKKVAENYINFK